MTDKGFEKLRLQIVEEKDGNRFSGLIRKLLKKYSLSNRENVLNTLIEYVKSGQIIHWRNFLLSDIVDLLDNSEAKYTDFFYWCITQPELTYWGIDGLVKTKGTDAYPALVDLAKNETLKTEVRAKSIKRIALNSKQPFDRGLPEDPGYWKPEDFRISEIESWQNSGYPEGEGYAQPTTHPSLENPQTDFEKIVAKLNRKLAKERSKDQDLSNPTNWLVVADETDLKNIEARWKLPDNYLLFLKNFSPLQVFIENKKYFEGLNLYGAADLLKKQEGYSFNPVTNEIIKEWPPNLIVIADVGANPYCIDLDKIKDNDAPIYTSTHGTGKWEFELYTNNFLQFLKGLI